jgi:hypothetical protein
MRKATAGEPRRNFVKPDDIRYETVDTKTGCRAMAYDNEGVRVTLLNDQKVCDAQSISHKDIF